MARYLAQSELGGRLLIWATPNDRCVAISCPGNRLLAGIPIEAHWMVINDSASSRVSRAVRFECDHSCAGRVSK